MIKNLTNVLLLSALSVALVTPAVAQEEQKSLSEKGKEYGSKAWEIAKRNKGKIIAAAAVGAALGTAATAGSMKWYKDATSKQGERVKDIIKKELNKNFKNYELTLAGDEFVYRLAMSNDNSEVSKAITLLNSSNVLEYFKIWNGKSLSSTMLEKKELKAIRESLWTAVLDIRNILKREKVI